LDHGPCTLHPDIPYTDKIHYVLIMVIEESRLNDGVLVIDKPVGPTSHDVVQIVKRTIGARKVGHLGTLDPAATGVLPLVINNATKHAEALKGGDKVYTFTLVLGTQTATDDDAGEVIATHPVMPSHREMLPPLIAEFIGESDQMPPSYSARSVGGVRLYKLARDGVVPEVTPRRICIHELAIEREDGLRISLRMRATAGTYVRALCRDIGARLGCGGHASGIRRLQSGRFTLAQAVKLEEVGARGLQAMIPLEVLVGNEVVS